MSFDNIVGLVLGLVAFTGCYFAFIHVERFTAFGRRQFERLYGRFLGRQIRVGPMRVMLLLTMAMSGFFVVLALAGGFHRY